MFGQPIRFDALSPIRVLALDLDGTLAVEGHEVSPLTRDALTELHRSGEVEIVICSGRRYRTTRHVIDNLGFATYTICNGGALTKDPAERTIDSQTFSPGAVAELADIARRHGVTLIAQRDSHALGGADFLIDEGAAWNGVTSEYFEENRDYAENVPLDSAADTAQILILTAFGDHEEFARFAAEIGQRYGRDLTTVIVPSALTRSWSIQVGLADVDKWSALRALADDLGVRPAAVCAVGDELNDLPMIIGAGIGVAMGDGNLALHAHADWVCGNHDADGLLDVIRLIRERNDH